MRRSNVKCQDLTPFWAVVMVLLCVGTAAGAQEATGTQGNEVVVVKEVSGEVGFVRPLYITVVYARDMEKGAEYEMVFPIDEDVTLLNRRSFDEINPGDTISVTYEERTWTTAEGLEKTERRAKAVRFVSAANTATLKSGQ